MSARTKPSVPSPRATPLHPMMLSPTASHFANNYNNNNYTRSQFYPTTSPHPSYYGGTSAAFPYQRTDSQYPLSDYGRSGYGMTNAYADYNPHIMHNPYAHGNTQMQMFGREIPIGDYAFWAGQKLAAGAAAGLGVQAYSRVGHYLYPPSVAAPGHED